MVLAAATQLLAAATQLLTAATQLLAAATQLLAAASAAIPTPLGTAASEAAASAAAPTRDGGSVLCPGMLIPAGWGSRNMPGLYLGIRSLGVGTEQV